MRGFAPLILLVLIMSSGCHRKLAPSQTVESDGTIANYFNAQVKKPLSIIENASPRQEDAFELNGARIVGDTLLVDVAFSGGCKEHSFEMSTNKQWLKSLPPQINLNLIHRANSDDCRSMLMGTLRFDLTSIRHPQSRSIQIIINQDSNQKILYTY